MEDNKYLTLGNIRKLDLPDETPVIIHMEPGVFVANSIKQAYVSQDDLDEGFELEEVESEPTDDCPVLAIYFE